MNKILLLSASLLFLNSCGYLILKPMSNSYIKKHKTELLPPDFFSGDNTLIILLDPDDKVGQRSYNKKMQKKVPMLYHGKYKFMTLEKYMTLAPEQEEYRYVFTHTEPVVNSSGGTTARRFYMLDYKTQKTYLCEQGGSFYMRVVESYFNNLEKWRLEATGK